MILPLSVKNSLLILCVCVCVCVLGESSDGRVFSSLRNHKVIGFLAILVWITKTITKLPSMLGHHRRLDNGPLLLVFQF